MLILLYLIGCLKILWQPTPVFLPGESHGWRSLVGYSPRGCKESDTTEQLHFHVTFKDFMSLQSHHPGFPGDSACNAGDLGSIPGSERSPGEGNGNPLQQSCLENSMDKEHAGYSPWVQRVKHTHTHTHTPPSSLLYLNIVSPFILPMFHFIIVFMN